MRPRRQRLALLCGPSTSPLDVRMHKLLRLVPIVLLAGCVSTASRSPPPEHYFDCDVPPGKFSEWSRTVSTRVVRASGTLELIEPRHDERWAPVANVFISGKDNAAVGGLRAYLDWHAPEALHFILVGRGATQSGQAILSVPWQGQVTPFTVAVSRSGELKVSAADAAGTLQLTDLDIRGVRLVCSTAQFKFRRVIVDERQ